MSVLTTAFSPTRIPLTSVTSTVSIWPLKSLKVTVFPLTAVTVHGGGITLFTDDPTKGTVRFFP